MILCYDWINIMKAKPFPERIQNIKEKFTTLKITTLCHKPGERGVRNGYVIVYAYFVRTATANNRTRSISC